MRQNSDRPVTSEGFSSGTERIKRRKNIKKGLVLCGLVSFSGAAEWCSSGCEGKEKVRLQNCTQSHTQRWAEQEQRMEKGDVSKSLKHSGNNCLVNWFSGY